MGEEQVIIKAGPVGIVLGSKTREDMNKLKFLVTLAGTYEYVQDGSLRILRSETKKAADEAGADPKVKGRISMLGECGGNYYLAAEQAAAVHLLKKKGCGLKVVDETEIMQVLQEEAKSEKPSWQGGFLQNGLKLAITSLAAIFRGVSGDFP